MIEMAVLNGLTTRAVVNTDTTVYFCGNTFTPSPQTGPNTGVGNMGQSYGLNVVCPKCGSTNVDGPRLLRIDEDTAVYPATTVSGIELFTGESLSDVDRIDGI